MQVRTGLVVILISIAIIFIAGCTGPVSPVPPAPAPVITPVPAPAVIVTAIPTVTATTKATVVVTPAQTMVPVPTPTPVPESALNARVQDAKNKLDMLKNSDMADTIMIAAKTPGSCEVKQSKELGYLIDAGTGDMSFIKGDYGSISLDRFRQNMTPGHTYVILHSHAKDWIYCRNTGTVGLNTFSLADLAAPSTLTGQGYHVQKMIVVSDKMYEVYPKTPDNWKTEGEVYATFNRIEQRLEANFHYDYYDSAGVKKTWYDVDMIMPMLAKELGYTYIVDNTIVP
ncbi:hypothetical protein [uncultured Methanoregula sp.]|uniref:hypothetical protein n=1 Tax=uncultured Methanoregula sp. TaxID=1005933 RepID=UPI002AAB5A67|nr:hypothetical protein [uncultured Methanoregula sp.]